MIKTVFIDVDNTLLDFNECAKHSMAVSLKEYGHKYKDSYFGVFKGVNDELWREIEKGTLTREGLYKVRWNRVFERLGIAIDGPEFEEKFIHNLHSSAVPVAGAHDILAYLSEKYTLCVTSNALHQQQVTRLKNADMLGYLDHIFTSEDIGSQKPEKAFFDGCFARLGDILPEECIIIGDSLTADIKGGIDCGIKTCWFNYEQKAPKGDEADYIVNTLAEIKNIL